MPLLPRMIPRLPVALRTVSVVMALGLIAGIAQMQTCRAEAKAPREPSSGEQSEGASGRTVFVENGDPKCIRPVGYRWAFTPDYVAFNNGPRSILFGGMEIGEGDFHLTARLAVTCPDIVPTFVARTSAIKGFQQKGIPYASKTVAQHRHLAMPPGAKAYPR